MKQLYKLFFIIIVLVAPVIGYSQTKGQQPSDSTSSFVRRDTAACVSFEWHDIIYEQSDIFYDTVGNGSDMKVIEWHLTINHPDTAIDNQESCGAYTWINSVTYTVSTNTPTVTLTNAVGCDSIVTLHLTIYPLPEVAVATTADTVCGNGEIWVSNVNPNYSYKWKNNTTNTWISVDSSDTYFVIATDTTTGCFDTAFKTITINQPYYIIKIDTICQGDIYSFGGYDFTSSGVYLDTLLANNGCDSIVTLILTVIPRPALIIFGDTAICEGDSTILTAFTGIDCTYQWISSADTVCSNSITVSDSGIYRVSVIESLYSCSATDSVMLTVHPIPTVTITGDTSICQGTSTTLKAEGVDAYTYIWNNGSSIDSITVTYEGVYTVIANDINGCMVSDTIVVSVDTLPIVTIDGATSICQGDSTILTAMGADNYIWSTYSESASDTVVAGTYYVTGTNSYGCSASSTIIVTEKSLPNVRIEGDTAFCQGSTATLTVLGADDYLWSTGETLVSIIVSDSGTFSVTGTNSFGCSASASHYVRMDTLPNVFINGDSSFCEGYNTTLVASGAALYTWSNGANTDTIIVSDPNTYTVTGTNSYGCKDTAKIHVNIDSIIRYSFSDTTCLSYEWNGEYYDVSGDYTQIFHADTNINRCDSIVTLHLTINNPTYTDVFLTECGSFIWEGDTLTHDTVYIKTFSEAAANKCDSIVTLHLTIIPTIQNPKSIVSKKNNKGAYMLVYPDQCSSYQWFKREGEIDKEIKGEIKQYYAPGGTLNDSICYKVRVTPLNSSNNCGVKTECWKDNTKNSDEIRILPNPNDGRFRLMLPEGTVNVQIFNTNGQVVLARKVDGNELMDMNTGLSNGLYFVKTFLKDGSCNTEKLIINR